MSTQKLKHMKMFLMRCVIKGMKRQKQKRQLFRLRNKHGISRPSKPEDWEIVKGDIVEVIRGRDEGKQGKVLQVYRRGESVLIDGINLRLHKQTGDAGEIETLMRPSRVMVKNVALVDQDTGIPTPIEWKFSQAAADKDRYTRVRQATVSGDIISKPAEAKTKRKLREPHPEKDTQVKWANHRTWIGPWDLFTTEQKEYIINDAKDKLPHVNDIEAQLPELIYNNVEEVQEYIRMLPYCPHTFFKIGNCEPHFYEKDTLKKWSKRRIRRNLRRGEGKKEYSEELINQLEDRRTFPYYLTHPIDPDSHWPRVHPDIDPKFKIFNKTGYNNEFVKQMLNTNMATESFESIDNMISNENEIENENFNENEIEFENDNEYVSDNDNETINASNDEYDEYDEYDEQDEQDEIEYDNNDEIEENEVEYESEYESENENGSDIESDTNQDEIDEIDENNDKKT